MSVGFVSHEGTSNRFCDANPPDLVGASGQFRAPWIQILGTATLVLTYFFDIELAAGTSKGQRCTCVPTLKPMTFWKRTFTNVEDQLKWAVLFALVLAALTTFRDVAGMDERQELVIWLWGMAAQLTLFLYWAFATPLVLHVMDWIRRSGRHRVHAAAILLGLYLPLGSLFFGFVALVNIKIWPMYGVTYKWKGFLSSKMFGVILLNSALKYYVPVLLGGAFYAYYRGMREEEFKAAELKQQLSDSQFRLLKMQLHPHFLFNALHSISALVYSDPPRADRIISQLSDLLRLSLETTEVVTVPLQEELQYVMKYLEIERIRFSDRLQTSFSVEPGTLSIDVPNLILQPLVENAIKHGTSKLSGGGCIDIKIYRERGGLIIAVEDNGPGVTKNGAPGGVGTRNVRERLQRLYDFRAKLTLKSLQPHGMRQELFIPVDDVAALFEARPAEFRSPS
jgi:two-component system, LytTR family, sensor kinase